jgi:hypothetical protein
MFLSQPLVLIDPWVSSKHVTAVLNKECSSLVYISLIVSQAPCAFSFSMSEAAEYDLSKKAFPTYHNYVAARSVGLRIETARGAQVLIHRGLVSGFTE